ncbi:MAG TPA: multidrug MFS transporter [Enterococcus sp.]|nr:multidrug MFS transporter [Enterococcus sp.]
MIFVTVGTHEQQFNRLIEKVDNLVAEGKITEKVFIQTGYSTYEPSHCEWSKFIPYNQLQLYIKEARIVITHGGPATFIDVLRENKKPLVVPRLYDMNEHVNNHQLSFVRRLSDLGFNLTLIEDISYLEENISNYKETSNEFSSNNQKFNDELTKLITGLLGE